MTTQHKQYFCIEPSRFRLDGGAMFGIIPRPLWQKVAPPDEMNRIDLALRLLLIKDPEREKVILVDTGIGDYHGKVFDKRFDVRGETSPLSKSLSEIGLAPDDITDLIISHLHFDHAGGMAIKNDDSFTPLFKNAKYHIHRKHYEYALNPTPRDTGSFHSNVFGPLIEALDGQGKVHWLDGDSGNIVGDINFKVSHGHTPWLIHPFDDKIIYLTDLIPTSNHVRVPWVMGYDISPGVTASEKSVVLSEIEAKNLTVMYEHDPKFWGSKIAKEKNDFTYTDEKACEWPKHAYEISP